MIRSLLPSLAFFFSFDASAYAALVALSASGGTLADGSGVTYMVTGNVPTDGGSGDLRNPTTSGTAVTFAFSGPVTFHIDNVTQGSAFTNVNFDAVDGSATSNTFTANTGIWAFTDNPGNTTISTSGSSLLFSGLADGTWVSDQTNWGDATISGVISISWVVPNVSNFESFNFTAMGTVPEPSRAILFACGISLAVLRRRRGR